MPTMPRLAVHACTTLVYAGLLFTSAITNSCATDECSESYRICNGGCNRRAENGVGFCKIQCDYRLIACDRQSTAAGIAHGEKYSVSTPAR